MYLVCTWYVPEVCTEANMICTWYVLGMNWYHETRKRNNKHSITLGIEPSISCTPSCVLYHYATSVHSLVIWRVNSRYIDTEHDIHDSLYLLAHAGVVLCWSRSAPGSCHDITGPDINLNFPDAELRCRTGLRS
jgi:hypothetical protein